MPSKLTNFLKTDLWTARLEELPRTKAFFIKQLRIIVLAARGFISDRCFLRAPALTFYSLLSVVPVVAMAFGVAKGFGSEKLLEKQLLEKFPGQEEALAQVVNFAHSLLDETKGGMMAGIGVGFLFLIVIMLLSNIESSLNDIWCIKKQRSFRRKLSDYISIMLICPILILMSSSITVFIVTQIKTITEKFAIMGVFAPLIFFSLKLLPYCVICGVFAFIYIFIPNTRVKFKAGLLAGIIAGTAYQAAQWGYIYFQIGVAQYNAIYGSFAALPLFLMWLQISWFIVLFGAEISFNIQNLDSHKLVPYSMRVSTSFKKLLSLQVAHLLIKNFSVGHKPLTAVRVANTLGIPIFLVNRVLHELVEGNIASKIIADGKDMVLTYQPACDTGLLTAKYVLDALENIGAHDIPIAQTKDLKALSETLQTFSDTIEKSPANRLLKDI